MIASVKLPSDDAQIDASRYDSDKGGMLSVAVVLIWCYFICSFHCKNMVGLVQLPVGLKLTLKSTMKEK